MGPIGPYNHCTDDSGELINLTTQLVKDFEFQWLFASLVPKIRIEKMPFAMSPLWYGSGNLGLFKLLAVQGEYHDKRICGQ